MDTAAVTAALERQDDGSAARSHLEESSAIYYEDATFPDGLVRIHSGGRREDIRIGAERQIEVLHEN